MIILMALMSLHMACMAHKNLKAEQRNFQVTQLSLREARMNLRVAQMNLKVAMYGPFKDSLIQRFFDSLMFFDVL